MFQGPQSLLQFLRQSRQILLLQEGYKKGSIVNIVIGNQTADLDSSLGSILLAYFFQTTQPGNKFFVPLINTDAKLFSSHFDVLSLLEQYKNELVCLDAINLPSLKQEYELELILYDHNIPETFWLSEANRVNSIYDHHEDKTDGYYTQPIAKNIKTLGSAMTLVAHEYRLHDYLLTQEIRKMILTTILIDTFNFDPKLKNTRWTELDQEEFSLIVKGDFDSEATYKHINSLKYSKPLNLQLDFEGLMLKDYKDFAYKSGRCGYAVIFISLNDLQEKYSLEEFKARLTAFQQVVFFVYPKDSSEQLSRDVLILNQSDEALKQTKLLSLSQVNRKLNIQKNELPSFDHYLYFNDVLAQYTRKTFEPIFSSIL